MFSRLETPSGERNTRCTMMTWWLLTTVVLSLASQQTGGKSKKKEELFSFTLTKWNVFSCPTGESWAFWKKKILKASVRWKWISDQASIKLWGRLLCIFPFLLAKSLLAQLKLWEKAVFWIAHALTLYKSVFFFFFHSLPFLNTTWGYLKCLV